MKSRATRWVALLIALMWISGCDDGGIINNPVPDATEDVVEDMTGDLDEDVAADVAADVPSDLLDEPDTGPTFESLFSECTGDGECEDNEVCFQEVCLRPPVSEVVLWREQSNQYIELDEAPDFSCWADPVDLGEADPAVATARGDVDLFGPASPTRNLCISAYNGDLLLKWMVWLDENVCGELHDVDLRDQEPYVNCFALDPCRCEDDDFTQYRLEQGASQEECYAEIGFCAEITDATLQQECRDNILARTGEAADTLIYGSTMSTPHPDNPDRTEGVYELGGLPTNTHLVFKVSGRISRWRDTYEYGAILPAAEVNDDGQISWSTNVITDGAWRTIPQSAGIPEPTPPDRVAVAGIVRDCSDNNNQQVSGARVGFVADPVQIAYFNGVASDTLPQPGQTDTNTDGVYAAISGPAGANRVSVAVLQDAVQLSAGVRDVFAPPFSVVIATFEGNWE